MRTYRTILAGKIEPTDPINNTHFMLTQQGILDCTPKEFDKETYQGLNRKHPNSHKTSMNPTNIGDPNEKK